MLQFGFTTEDQKEGYAFVEKRKPNFKGKIRRRT